MQRTKLAIALTLALSLSIPAAAGWAQPLTENATTPTPTELWQAVWRGVLAWWQQAMATIDPAAGSGPQSTVEFGSQMDPNG